MDASTEMDSFHLARLHGNKIKREVDAILNAYFYHVRKYDPIRCSFLCQSLCKMIRDRCQEISISDDCLLKRDEATPIKFIVNVVIGQDLGQEFHLTCSSLSQPRQGDRTLDCFYRNKVIFAIVLVHAFLTHK